MFALQFNLKLIDGEEELRENCPVLSCGGEQLALSVCDVRVSIESLGTANKTLTAVQSSLRIEWWIGGEN